MMWKYSTKGLNSFSIHFMCIVSKYDLHFISRNYSLGFHIIYIRTSPSHEYTRKWIRDKQQNRTTLYLNCAVYSQTHMLNFLKFIAMYVFKIQCFDVIVQQTHLWSCLLFSPYVYFIAFKLNTNLKWCFLYVNIEEKI